MRKQLVKTVSILMVFIVYTNSVRAQSDPNPYGQNTQRSIWDKEPEPKTSPSPFGGGAQRATTGLVQQNGTPTDPPPFGGNTQDGVPIDGGLGFLLVAGAGYGVKKLKQHRKMGKKMQK